MLYVFVPRKPFGLNAVGAPRPTYVAAPRPNYNLGFVAAGVLAMASASRAPHQFPEKRRKVDGALDVHESYKRAAVVICFGKQDVVDTLTFHQCATVGVSLDHTDGLVFGILSFGQTFWKTTFQTKEIAPLVMASLFDIFTTKWQSDSGIGNQMAWHPGEPGRRNTRLFDGTKGEAATALLLPTFPRALFVLVDDREENIEEFITELPTGRASGVLVRMGRKRKRSVCWRCDWIGQCTQVVTSAVELLQACLRFAGRKDEWAVDELALERDVLGALRAHENEKRAAVVICFDKHDVVDTLSYPQCASIEVSLDHVDELVYGILSFGQREGVWQGLFEETAEFSPLLSSSLFEIFTSKYNNEGGFGSLTAEHPGEPGRPNTRFFSGTKGEAAREWLLPAFRHAHFVLVDDKEENIEEFIKAMPSGRASGVLVRMGRKRLRRVRWMTNIIGQNTEVVTNAVALLSTCLRFAGKTDEWAVDELTRFTRTLNARTTWNSL